MITIPIIIIIVLTIVIIIILGKRGFHSEKATVHSLQLSLFL